MPPEPKRKKVQENTLSTLNVLIEGLNLAKEISSITPAKAAFGSVSVLLGMIRVRSSSLCDVERLVHVRQGHCAQPKGLRRSRHFVCRHM